ncbi:Sec-independent protein translocase protein TatB [Thiocapsa bogorovii]|uniref:Sec-independent protein translocase protein TatB n=1 Tax=Thiocapsa bogorovii TaxID=521689 RepID=UPI001E64D385|nr:Sec-independent protein translocase protein TatB [Thiocapsa bogorovii]UHD18553.1 Sec-independent protein translocase protein TatB [Thiocapsa bogorovii]
MFDMGFWELLVIGVVALVVIGPERLPKVARIAGLWLGRARRTLSSVQEEIRRELKADELKEILDKQARSRPLESILEEPAERAARPASITEAAPTPPQDQASAGLDGSTAARRPVERDTSAS